MEVVSRIESRKVGYSCCPMSVDGSEIRRAPVEVGSLSPLFTALVQDF